MKKLGDAHVFEYPIQYELVGGMNFIKILATVTLDGDPVPNARVGRVRTLRKDLYDVRFKETDENGQAILGVLSDSFSARCILAAYDLPVNNALIEGENPREVEATLDETTEVLFAFSTPKESEA